MSDDTRRAWSDSDVEFARSCRSIPVLLWFVDDKERAPLMPWWSMEQMLNDRQGHAAMVVAMRAKYARRRATTDTEQRGAA